ncbi:MAG TPA: hypothetical protein VEK57_24835 [Thermoanaerobaculia bacterium]|nr:hypothetical protein [Thermoanaerobaculia bacterium]
MTAIDISALSLDLSVLLGDWRNTNAEGAIARIVCRDVGREGVIDVQCHGIYGNDVTDWGSVSARVYAFTFDSREAGAFNAVFRLRGTELGGTEPDGEEIVHMQANVKSGVLVVAIFTEVRDRSGRTNYFDREFFHRISK